VIRDQSLEKFLDQLAGPTATPGGGGAAAISGAMGAALVSMACRLTIGRPRFSRSEDILQKALANSEALRERLLQLAEADRQAFERVMAAYRLPKTTEVEKTGRRAEVQAALQEATQTQAQVAVACAEVIRQTARIIDKVNPNTVGDAAAAVHLADAGLKIGQSNANINLKLLDDPQVTGQFQNILVSACEGVEAARNKALAQQNSR
jgi:formiminotetrahydrofolate cyclodeaminase